MRRIVYRCRYCQQQFSFGNIDLPEIPDSELLRNASENILHYCDGGGGHHIGIADKIGLNSVVL